MRTAPAFRHFACFAASALATMFAGCAILPDTEGVLVYDLSKDTVAADTPHVYIEQDTVRITSFPGGPSTVDSFRVYSDRSYEIQAVYETGSVGAWVTISQGPGAITVPTGSGVWIRVTHGDPGSIIAPAYSGVAYLNDSLARPFDSVVVILRAPERPEGMARIGAKDSTFLMGSLSSDGLLNEQPRHSVTITYDFWMDTSEVTRGSYANLLALATPPAGQEALPVLNVTWFDAMLYCNARSKRDGFDTVFEYSSLSGTPGSGGVAAGPQVILSRNGYRLATEAEWEYACRARSNAPFYWGGYYSVDTVSAHAWYSDNSSGAPKAVGQKRANRFGLRDMYGNAFEWCLDRYQDYPSADPLTDPVTLITDALHKSVIRGGAYSSPWETSAVSAAFRSAYREEATAASAFPDVGFRCVLPAR